MGHLVLERAVIPLPTLRMLVAASSGSVFGATTQVPGERRRVAVPPPQTDGTAELCPGL